VWDSQPYVGNSCRSMPYTAGVIRALQAALFWHMARAKVNAALLALIRGFCETTTYLSLRGAAGDVAIPQNANEIASLRSQ